MRRRLIAANWKMHGNKAQNAALIQDVLAGLNKATAAEVILAVPFVYLQQVSELLDNSIVALAAQNVSEYESGAFTGEVSVSMLQDFTCRYALVGHSERRELFNETDEMIIKKFHLLQTHNIQPILCVGETLSQRDTGHTDVVVRNQLHAVIRALGVEALKNCVLAYEPVWAIGTGKTASPQQAQEVHQFLRQQVAVESINIAESLRIIYGGSVNETNAQSLFEQADIDGGLIGGASLNAESFLHICKVI